MRNFGAKIASASRGEYYGTESATIYDRPKSGTDLRRGRGPMIAKYAGRDSDGFICTSGKAPCFTAKRCCPTSTPDLNRHHARSDAIDRMIEVKVSFDTGPCSGRPKTRAMGGADLSAEEKLSVEDPLEMERLADALPLERAAKRWIVSTDPDEHVARIKTYIDLGFRHLVFHAPGKDQARFIRLYAEQVLPRLRALAQ